jgi:hypothetical protein
MDRKRGGQGPKKVWRNKDEMQGLGMESQDRCYIEESSMVNAWNNI